MEGLWERAWGMMLATLKEGSSLDEWYEDLEVSPGVEGATLRLVAGELLEAGLIYEVDGRLFKATAQAA